MRLDYSENGIDEQALLDDPMSQWELWLSQAVDAGVDEPNAMVIATISEGQPRTRAVLAKGASHGGIEFYTNYQSPKGRALGEVGPISATFVWYPLQRQVTMVGSAAKLSAAESDDYFAVRPREAQLGAWTSEQSAVIASRDVLAERFAHFDALYPDGVPRPPHWGGYRIVPVEVEFWQGRTNRLHDRICYTAEEGRWERNRLSP
jgi:pyridoxamine 5'-phosphate oxidase